MHPCEWTTNGLNHHWGGYWWLYSWGNSRISLFGAATNFLWVFNMSATMSTQAGWVQLEQSDMCLALNMAKMAKAGFSRSAIEELQNLIRNPRAEVQGKRKRGFQLAGHKHLKAAIERHLAILCQNHPTPWLPCQNGTTKFPHTCWRHKETCAPPPDWSGHPTSEPTTPLPGLPPAPTRNNFGAQSFQIVNLPAGYAYSYTFSRWVECVTLNESSQQSLHDTDVDSDMLIDEDTSTGWYTICCVVMQLASRMKTRAVYWENLQVMTSIDWKARDLEIIIIYNQQTP